MGGFKVGGGYIDAGDYNAISGVPGSSGDTTVWHVGISYTAGPVAVGLTYADAEGFKSGPSFDEATLAPSVGTYATSYKTYGGGVAYTIAPGFVVQADLMYVDEDLRNVDLTTGATATTSNEGYVAVLSTAYFKAIYHSLGFSHSGRGSGFPFVSAWPEPGVASRLNMEKSDGPVA